MKAFLVKRKRDENEVRLVDDDQTPQCLPTATERVSTPGTQEEVEETVEDSRVSWHRKKKNDEEEEEVREGSEKRKSKKQVSPSSVEKKSSQSKQLAKKTATRGRRVGTPSPSQLLVLFQRKKDLLEKEEKGLLIGEAQEEDEEEYEEVFEMKESKNESKEQRRCVRESLISYQEVDECDGDEVECVEKGKKVVKTISFKQRELKQPQQRIGFVVGGVIYRELKDLVNSVDFKRQKISHESPEEDISADEIYEIGNSDSDEFEENKGSSSCSSSSKKKKAKNPHKFFMTKEQKAQLKAQETLQKFQEELNRSRQASVDFFSSKKVAVNPFFTNVSASIKALPPLDLQTPNDQKLNSSVEESPYFPSLQHVGTDPVLLIRLPNMRQILSWDEMKVSSEKCMSFHMVPSLKTQNSFAFHRQSEDMSTLRQLWLEYALRKCPSISMVSDTKKEVQLIDLDPAAEVIDLDPPVLHPPKSVVDWSTLESSVNNVTLELHHMSLQANKGKVTSSHSLMSAQSQIIQWLKHWKSRSELDVTSRERRRRFQRSSKRLPDDDEEFEDFDEMKDYGDEDTGNRRENETNLVILSGRCGISKSSLVHAAALSCGYSIIELNSSHDRSGQNIKKLVAEAAQSQTLKTQDGLSCNEGFNLILFDEVDILFKVDTSFLNAISQLLQNAKCPVILTSELSEISQLQCFKNIDPPPLLISVLPPDHASLGVFLYQLLQTNQYFKMNSVLTLQDLIDLAYLSQGDLRASLTTLSFLGPRRKRDSDKEIEICPTDSFENEDSFVDWAKFQGFWGDALEVMKAMSSRKSKSFIVDDITLSLNEAIINMLSSAHHLPTRNSSFCSSEGISLANVTPRCDDELFCPVISLIEPNVVNSWAPGSIKIFGRNFLQLEPTNSDRFIPLKVSLEGFGEFEPIIYSDTELGLRLPQYFSQESVQNLSIRQPTITLRLVVILKSEVGFLSSSMCEITPSWIAFADCRVPEDLHSFSKRYEKGRIRKKRDEKSLVPLIVDSDDDFELAEQSLPQKFARISNKSCRSSKRSVIQDEDDEDDKQEDQPEESFTDRDMTLTPQSTLGSSSTQSQAEEKRVKVDIYKMMRASLTALKSHSLIGPFLLPFDHDSFPDYDSIITNPMDIGTVESSVSESLYTNLHEFIQDVHLVFQNLLDYSESRSQEISHASHNLTELADSAVTLKKYFDETMGRIQSNTEDYQTQLSTASLSLQQVRCSFEAHEISPLASPPSLEDLSLLHTQAKAARSVPSTLYEEHSFVLRLHKSSSAEELNDLDDMLRACQMVSDIDCYYGHSLVSKNPSYGSFFQSNLSRVVDDEMMYVNGSKISSEEQLDKDCEDQDPCWWECNAFVDIANHQYGSLEISESILRKIRSHSPCYASYSFQDPHLFSFHSLEAIRIQKIHLVQNCLLNLPLNRCSLSIYPNIHTLKRSLVLDHLPMIIHMLRSQGGNDRKRNKKKRQEDEEDQEEREELEPDSVLRSRRSSRLFMTPILQKYHRVYSLLQIPVASLEELLRSLSFPLL